MLAARRTPVRRLGPGAMILLAAFWCANVVGQEPAQPQRGGDVPRGRLLSRLGQALAPSGLDGGELGQQRMVLCLSREFFTSLLDHDVDRLTPVQEVVLGTPVAGQSRTVARPTVNLVPHDSQAVFEVVLEGTTVSRTTGRNRAAIVYSRATTTFRATKQVVFEPASGFHASPATIEARTQLVTEGVDATSRCRLIRGLVRDRAWQEVQRQHPQAEAIAHQRAQRRIGRLFDDRLEQGLARLNRATELRDLVAALVPGESRLAIVCCSTEDCVQFALSRRGSADSELPVTLPEAPRAAGPMQLWIHSSLLGARFQRLPDRFPLAGRFVGPWLGSSHAAATAVLTNRLASLLAGDEPLWTVRTAGEWVVVPLSGGPQEQIARRAVWR